MVKEKTTTVRAMRKRKVTVERPTTAAQLLRCEAPAFLKDKEGFDQVINRCGNTNILLSIIEDGQKYPICSSCWSKICESDLEWTGFRLRMD